MTAAHRCEARIALAMLPVGAVMLVVSAGAFLAVIALAVTLSFAGSTGLGWIALWCLLAAAIALWNARAGIEMMIAFDWRPLPMAVVRSVAALLGYAALP